MTQVEMNACAAAELARVDADLNAAYAEARSAMRQRDASQTADQTADQTGAERTLRDAQRAWIAYRDLACAAEGFLVRGGSIEPLVVLMCKTRLTQTRVDDLRGLIPDEAP